MEDIVVSGSKLKNRFSFLNVGSRKKKDIGTAHNFMKQNFNAKR